MPPFTFSPGRLAGAAARWSRYHFPFRVPGGLRRTWTIAYSGHQWHGRVV
jgi:hypothetical protein